MKKYVRRSGRNINVTIIYRRGLRITRNYDSVVVRFG